MQKPHDLPRTAGVFALLHAASAEAYVNETKNLRARALLWEMWLDNQQNNVARVPARNFPSYRSDEWRFWVSAEDHATTRLSLTQQGWRLINSYRPRQSYAVTDPATGEIATGTLSELSRRFDVAALAAYKRLAKGMSVEQALGLTAIPMMDKREQAIAQMRVQIESANGGLLTFDEAVMLRPQLGDIRKRLYRMRKRDPSLTRIKLADIPV